MNWLNLKMIVRKFLLGSVVAIMAVAGSISTARADDVVVPNLYAAEASPAGGSYGNQLFTNSTRVQWLISASELQEIQVGEAISAVSLRVRPGTPTMPTSDVLFSSFAISIGEAATTPASYSDVFANNIANAVPVRSGPLNVVASSLVAGATFPSANPFSLVIGFDTPYTYQGGGIVIDITHSGSPGGTSLNVFERNPADESTAGIGYRALFGTTSFPSANGTNDVFPVLQLTTIPAPSGAVALFAAAAMVVRRRR